ncbi:MlaD family protein [Bradyrhizobium sp. 2TAF24]|uniref:MlaD family protein n=1 Tax=Bradyrhizobium sp. 2TAF24 TaxID=3233011 RepID=UPI003F8E83AD
METRANYVLIGLFTLAVLACGFGFVMWFQSIHAAKARNPLRIVFEGSASGLRTGASVNFNGIRVGEVTSVRIDDPKRVIALASVDKSAPIRQDTVVGLEFQGLTGVAAIALKGGSPDASEVPPGAGGIPTLTADLSATQDIMESVRSSVQNLNRLVADNQEAVRASLRSIEAFATTLAQNSERIDSIMSGVDAFVGGKDGGQLAAAVRSFKDLADNLDKRTAEITANVNRLTLSTGRDFGALVVDGRRTLDDISRAVNNFDRNPTRVLFGASNTDARAPEPRSVVRIPANANARARGR